MNITSGKLQRALRVVVYGSEGIGKTTFAAQFPDPLFIDTEGGTAHMDVRRIDRPQSWSELLSIAQEVAREPVCKTLVLDTADWAEALCIAHVCQQYKQKSIEGFGYGKGYTIVYEEFKRLISALDTVIASDKNVVVTAHAKMRKFEQPDEMGAYDRWEMKLSKQVAPLVKEWADMLLFLNYKTYVVTTETNTKKAQGGKRVMYATHHPCWDAKNRYGLPDESPLDYAVIKPIVEPKPELQPQPGPETLKTDKPKREAKKTNEAAKSEPAASDGKVTEKDLDERIPQKLRDLMLKDSVDEWSLQNVVKTRMPNAFPHDTEVWEYPEEFLNEWMYPNWDKVVKFAREAMEKEEIPF